MKEDIMSRRMVIFVFFLLQFADQNIYNVLFCFCNSYCCFSFSFSIIFSFPFTLTKFSSSLSHHFLIPIYSDKKNFPSLSFSHLHLHWGNFFLLIYHFLIPIYTGDIFFFINPWNSCVLNGFLFIVFLFT